VAYIIKKLSIKHIYNYIFFNAMRNGTISGRIQRYPNGFKYLSTTTLLRNINQKSIML